MLTVTIIAGGVGSRLAPLSTSNNPKQFLKLTDDNYSMFQLTIKRIIDLQPQKLVVICNENNYDLAFEQLQLLKLTIEYLFILEPIGRNTAPAICLTTLINPDTTMLVVPSDHIFDNQCFVNSVKEGLKFTNEGITVFGITPSYPETGYGYIKYNKNNIIKFVEKPDIETAKQYLEDGNYAWNSGVFLFNTSIMSSELLTHCPDIYNGILKIVEKIDVNSKKITVDKTEFSQIRDQSIDYAVMENHKFGKIVEYSGKWSDVGSFKSLYDELDKNADNNVIRGDNICSIDCNHCYINSDRGKIGLIGLSNLAVIKLKDTIIISDLEKTQDIKKLKFENKEFINETKFRPWGNYTTIEGGDYDGFKVKKIVVKPRQKLSLQSHNFRNEHWVITKGVCKMQLNDTFRIMKSNDYVFIPIKALHRIENIGDEDVEFIETQIGSYLGEDDIVRYQDDYGRV